MVKNTILVDTYAKQENTVDYQGLSTIKTVQGGVTFNSSLRVVVIALGEKKTNKK